MNIEKYEKDIDRLVDEGQRLFYSMYFDENPAEREKQKEAIKKLGKLPDFHTSYQSWYSEALECLKQLLPSRVDDFVAYYKSKSVRKEITYQNYTVYDFLDGLTITRGLYKDKVVGPDAAIRKFQQQLEIVKALKRKFKSSLFDIKTLAQADLFENELDASAALNKNGFHRAAGAVAGVVLEGHLGSVCDHHDIKITKKNPSISDFNDALKNADVIDTATWRKIQYLGDIRNKCDHKKTTEPSKEEIDELIEGTRKYVKTLF